MSSAILKVGKTLECDQCGEKKKVDVRVLVEHTTGKCVPMALCVKCANHKYSSSEVISRPLCQHMDCLGHATVIVSFPKYGKCFCAKHAKQSAGWFNFFSLCDKKHEHQA